MPAGVPPCYVMLNQYNKSKIMVPNIMKRFNILCIEVID
jgi:hypothetical protein